MNNNFLGSMIVVLTGIIGVATLAVLVSKNAQTASVIGAAGTAFSGALSAATAPVTGSSAGLSLGGGSGFSPSVQL
jgi:hypothetical protein